MQFNSRDSYLETEVLTATPQRLRKMLLDGAIRFATLARDLFAKQQDEDAHRALDRCSDILAELLAAVRPEDDLTRQIAGVYLFLMTQAIEIRKNPEVTSLNDLIEVLEIERETWRQVCEATPAAPTSRGPLPREIGSSEAASILSASLSPLSSAAENGGAIGSFELDA